MKKIARKIVNEIIHDMTGRSGGDHWFEGCDRGIQKEIRNEWVSIVARNLENLGAATSHNSDYMAALRIWDEYHGTITPKESGMGFTWWCKQRLNAGEPHCT